MAILEPTPDDWEQTPDDLGTDPRQRQTDRPKKEIFMADEVKWTEEQKQAIYEKGENILVAAAARKWKDSCTGRKNYK